MPVLSGGGGAGVGEGSAHDARHKYDQVPVLCQSSKHISKPPQQATKWPEAQGSW